MQQTSTSEPSRVSTKSVGGIAEDDAGGGEVVRVALDADEWEVRVSGELLAETVFADEFAGAGEVLAEER